VDTATPLSLSLINQIVDTHHGYLKAERPRLEALLQREAGSAVPGAVAEIFASIKQELEGHLMKEEHVLFPLIRALENGAAPPAFIAAAYRTPWG
jgi:regulator of cell morphogenesis and NO signaling